MKTLYLESCANPRILSAALCPAITIFLTKIYSFFPFVERRLSFPGSLHKSILHFLAFHQQKEKSTFNIFNTCPSSLNRGIHDVMKRLRARLCLARALTAAQNVNYSVDLCQHPEKTYDEIAITVNAALIESSW